jgi:predicted transcriptional regulator
LTSNLKDWIRQELTVNIENELVKYKERVKSLIQLSPSGEIILKQTNLSAKQKILTYIIGKVYSNFAQYSSDDSVTNQELSAALSIPDGTVKYYLHELRNEGLIIPLEKGVHKLRITQIGAIFDQYFPEGDVIE